MADGGETEAPPVTYVADDGEDGVFDAKDVEVVADLRDEGDDGEVEGKGDGEDGGEGEEDVEGDDEDVPDPAVARFIGHGDSVYDVAVHPTLPWALSGGGDDTAHFWSMQNGQDVIQLETPTHTDSVVAVGFSADGSLFATAGLDHKIKIWTTPKVEDVIKTEEKEGGSGEGEGEEDEKVLHPDRVLEGPTEDIEWIDWHPSLPALLVGSQDCTVWLFDAVKGDCLQVFVGHEAGVSCGAWLPSGKHLVSAGDDAQLRLWSARSGECKYAQTPDLSDRRREWLESGAIAIAVHPDPERGTCLVGGRDGTARLVSLNSRKVLATLVHGLRKKREVMEEGEAAGGGGGGGGGDEGDDAEEEEVEVSVEGVGFCAVRELPWAATGATDGSVKLWELRDHTSRGAWMQEGSITQLQWIPDRPVFLTAAADGTLHVYDARLAGAGGDPTKASRRIAAHTNITLQLRLWKGEADTEGDKDEERELWFAITSSDDQSCAVIPIENVNK